MNDDFGHDKFTYKENEVNLMSDFKVVNEHISFNKLKKIKNLVSLSENWESFHVLYKDDIILKKIGIELLKDGFEFNKNILKTIKDYPSRNKILYYFKKGEEIQFPELSENKYTEIKNKILPLIEKQSIIHLEQKNLY
ncbi:hypothetical protein GW796_06375 [archaeon]|nr:hypothetical protein [archaeon]